MSLPFFSYSVRPARIAILSLFLASTLGVSTIWQLPTARAATKKADKREIDARQAFAAGRYQQALDLFAALYAEKLHPTYLRNIGRCHQNLQQPDKAINAFRDYLRQAKDLPSAEKVEIDGYIVEMEALQKKQDAESAPAVANPPPPVLPMAGTESETAHPNLVQASTLPTTPASEPAPFYTRGWFWGTVGGVVVLGVVGGLWAGGVFSKASNHCPAGTVCIP
jgi:hypothetical protein